MNSTKCFHLFNCDNTYDLDVVVKLLDVIKTKTTGIDIQSKKEYFRLHHMSELTKTIEDKTSDKRRMDYAIFAVNANESRLSINEENARVGYAKLYRALLRATDERVIVVIGGDDNYRNTSEEDGSLLSRWARRKVSSQFKEEFMDGTKGFIFSWDKKHRVIHEEALLHFLDFKRKGQKFSYEIKPQAEPVQSETFGDQKQQTALHEAKIQMEEGEAFDKHAPEICQDVHTSGLQEETTEHDDAGAKSKEVMVLGRNQSDLALFKNLYGDELFGKVSCFSASPVVLKDTLKSHPMNSIRSCFIFLDGAAILEEFASHYKDLLVYVRDNVDEKVVAIICSDNRLIQEDTIADEIAEILREKACIIWWRETFSPQEQSARHREPLHRSQSLPVGSPKGSADRLTLPKHVEESLVLKTRLINGSISYDKVEKRSGEWTPPKEIEERLFDKWQSTPNLELLIYEQRETGKTHYRVVVKDDSQKKYIEELFGGIAAFGRAPSPPPLE